MVGEPSSDGDVTSSEDKMLHIVYGLYALTIVFTLAVIAGVVIAYMQRGKALDELQDSHVVWQIRTFWICLFLFFVGFSLPFLLGFVGMLMSILVPTCFYIYRVAKGWYLLINRRPIDDPGAIF